MRHDETQHHRPAIIRAMHDPADTPIADCPSPDDDHAEPSADVIQFPGERRIVWPRAGSFDGGNAA